MRVENFRWPVDILKYLANALIQSNVQKCFVIVKETWPGKTNTNKAELAQLCPFLKAGFSEAGLRKFSLPILSNITNIVPIIERLHASVPCVLRKS